MANCLDMVPAPSTALPAMAVEATKAAMVALLSEAAAMTKAARYAANWRLGDAKDSAAMSNVADWSPGDAKDSAAIPMQ